MTPEEYDRIKEAEKKHLLALKKLKAKLKQVESRNKEDKVSKAINDIANAPGEDILRTHEEMVDKLAMEAIHQEARLEIALSAEKEKNALEEEAAAAEQDEAELQKIRAQELVRKMKIQMGLEQLDRKQDPAQNVREDNQSSGLPASNRERAEGNKSGGAASAEPLPDKTIGRIPKKPS